MKYSTFEDILKTMQAREKTESQLYEMGLDITNIPNDLSGCVMKLFDEIYPESKDVIEYFCYETDYGRNYKDGVEDVFGRTVDLHSIYGLYSSLERQELSAWIHSEPYGEEPCLCAEGHYLGIDFWVYWNCFAPCAYLNVSGIDHAYDFLEDEVHGDITYVDTHLPFTNEVVGSIIGWDYGHVADYTSVSREGKKWSTHQIVVEIQEAIDSLKKKYLKI